MQDFNNIQNELLRFLESKKITFSYGNEFKKIEKAESSYQNKITKKSFQILKKKVKKCIVNHVNGRGLDKNLWQLKNQPSWSKKLKKIGIGEDEVDTTFCSNEDELKKLYLSVGLDDEKEFFKMSSESLNDAISIIRLPEILKNIPSGSSKNIEVDFFTLKKKKLNFTGVKI